MPENHPLLHWFLPTGEDRADTGRPARVARAAEQAGFTSLFAPVGPGRVDPWHLASVLAGHTERIGFLVGVRAGAVSPTLLAQQADAFRRFTGGRLRLNLVTGGDSTEHRSPGDQLAHDQRYGRTDEVMAVLRSLLDGGRIDFQGQHVQVEGARLTDPAVEHKVPLYLGGVSGAAENLAARRADVHLMWSEPAEPPETVAARVARLRDRNPALRFALRLSAVGRDDEVARRLHTYCRSGVDEFVLSGSPDPDDALRVGGEVAPRLRELLSADDAWENAAAPPPPGTGGDGAALASDGVTPASRRSGRCRRGCR
ncbi:LLM class flavin-dependent oxidoreductase [Streptomyces kunmingensis]|uniref:LLM class flavin-dependent oxidoreductase n=1 Tax=Streptomyces kunmingensis TaxID=68225 RepID=A0ABU6CK91_9ACTN|nr:LLM class flavin-dependent oxidoreductase [Streptomyces kunmingensis]MEB3965139.1 LLM class flavin-dependent oxidoreductase [Streptomyces kunmingensis]